MWMETCFRLRSITLLCSFSFFMSGNTWREARSEEDAFIMSPKPRPHFFSYTWKRSYTCSENAFSGSWIQPSAAQWNDGADSSHEQRRKRANRATRAHLPSRQVVDVHLYSWASTLWNRRINWASSQKKTETTLKPTSPRTWTSESVVRPRF